MYTVLVIVQVLVAIGLIGLILLQHGKGADAGAAFGSGASGTVFGSRGSANFLSRATGWLATVFFAVSLAIAYLVHGTSESKSVVDRVPGQAEVITPAGADGSPVTVQVGEIKPTEAAPAAAAEKPADQAPVVPE